MPVDFDNHSAVGGGAGCAVNGDDGGHDCYFETSLTQSGLQLQLDSFTIGILKEMDQPEQARTPAPNGFFYNRNP